MGPLLASMPQTKAAMDVARLCSKTKCSSNGWCVKEDVCQCYAGFSGAGCSLDLGTPDTVGDGSVSLKSDDTLHEAIISNIRPHRLRKRR